jgi:hypothetical protein
MYSQNHSNTKLVLSNTGTCEGGESWILGPLPSIVETRCEDMSESCDTYSTSTCGFHDTVSFNSSELCCVCGGGKTLAYADIVTDKVNREGYPCSDISRLVSHGLNELCTSFYDTDHFTASETCVACGGGVKISSDNVYEFDTPHICVNTDHDNVNSDGYSCSYLNALHDNENIAYDCETQADTSEFTASSMCCACGGGESWRSDIFLPSNSESRCVNSSSCDVSYVDMMTFSRNSEGRSCSDITVLLSYGFEDACTHSYDTNEFTALNLCVACGGGVEMVPDTWYFEDDGSICLNTDHNSVNEDGFSCSYVVFSNVVRDH